MQEVGFLHAPGAPQSSQGGRLAASEPPPLPPVAPPPAPSWEEALGRVIEAEIVPRLLLAHAQRAPAAPAAGANQADFAGLLVAPDMARALTYVWNLREKGVSTEAIFLDHLAPAARHLGELWESDHLDFLSVTLGLGRLRAIAQALESEWELSRSPPSVARCALFLPAPGEPHSFGLSMVSAFFRAAGWRVAAPGVAQGLDVIGFSMSCERYLPALPAAIAKARRASNNPALLVLVGGRLFNENPALLHTVGADATAPDAASAVRTAQSLLERGVFV